MPWASDSLRDEASYAVFDKLLWPVWAIQLLVLYSSMWYDHMYTRKVEPFGMRILIALTLMAWLGGQSKSN